MSRVDGPRPHQKEAVAAISHHLELGGRAQAIMACATGKTLVGLWSKEAVKARRTLVLAPTIALVDQIAREWQANSSGPFRALAVCSDDTVLRDDDEMAADVAVKVTTNADDVAEFLAADDQDLVVFSTYQSSPVVARAMRRPGTAPFDLTIADEAHHCATDRDSSFARVLSDDDIPSTRRLFMTATKRTFSNSNTSLVASMDDEETFGREVYSLPFREAIEKGLLADYQILVVAVEGVDGGNAELDDASRDVAMEVGLLKAMKEYNLRRVLTFHSRVSRAAAFAASLPEVSAQMGSAGAGDLSAAHVSGLMNVRTRDAIVQQLAGDSAGRVVVANVNCLGEGVDVPAIDSVCWIDPRTSVIQIIQGVGRGLRKNPGDEHNLATIIVPVEVDRTGVPRAEAISRTATVVQALAAHDQDLADLLQASFTPQLERATSSAGESIEPLRFIAPAEMIGELERTVRLRVLREAAVGATWMRFYTEVLNYAQVHGSLAGLTKDGANRRNHDWIRRQQRDHREGRLSTARVQALELVPGWSWVVQQSNVPVEAEVVTRMRILYEAGTSVSSAARECEVNVGTAKGIFTRNGWVRKEDHQVAWTVDDDAELQRLRESGRTSGEIAKELGRSVSAVNTRRLVLNLPVIRRQTAWTSDDDAELVRLKGLDRSQSEIAKELGRSVSAVAARRPVLNLPVIRRQAAWTPDDDAELQRLRESGRTSGEIAKELGRSVGAVQVRRGRLDLPVIRRVTAWMPDDDAELVRLKGLGRSRSEIAKELGRTGYAVQAKLAAATRVLAPGETAPDPNSKGLRRVLPSAGPRPSRPDPKVASPTRHEAPAVVPPAVEEVGLLVGRRAVKVATVRTQHP